MSTATVTLNLPFKQTSSSTITLQVISISQTDILVSFQGPNGNNAVGYSNNLFVWQGANAVPVNTAPVSSVAASGAAIAGSYGANDYIVGYSAGPAMTTGATTTYPNVCTTASIPADWDLSQVAYSGSSLTVSTAGTSFVNFNYSIPANFSPSVDGAWVGLWNGPADPYDSLPLAAVAIPGTNNQNSVALTGVNLQPNGTYTAALFRSGWNVDPSKLAQTTIAVVIEFETLAPLPASPADVS